VGKRKKNPRACSSSTLRWKKKGGRGKKGGRATPFCLIERTAAPGKEKKRGGSTIASFSLFFSCRRPNEERRREKKKKETLACPEARILPLPSRALEEKKRRVGRLKPFHLEKEKEGKPVPRLSFQKERKRRMGRTVPAVPLNYAASSPLSKGKKRQKEKSITPFHLRVTLEKRKEGRGTGSQAY